jgi:hypothetical protein
LPLRSLPGRSLGRKTVKVNQGPKDQAIPLCIPYKTKDYLTCQIPLVSFLPLLCLRYLLILLLLLLRPQFH